METAKQPTQEARIDSENAIDWTIPQLAGRIAVLQADLGFLQYTPRRQAEIRREIEVLDFELQMQRTEAYHAQQQGESA